MTHQTVAAFNFFKGHPSTSLLPIKEVRDASYKVLTSFLDNPESYDEGDNVNPLNYGPDAGNLDVRATIAKWNDRNFGLQKPTDPNCLNLTSGASYGIMNILSQTTSPHNNLTRRAFMASPTYFLVTGAFIDAGFGGKLSAILEVDDGQIDFEELEKQLKYYDSVEPVTQVEASSIPLIHDDDRPLKKIYRYVFYLTPTFSNPRGGTLSIYNRLRLIDIARKYDMLIIADDVYDLLDYSVPSTETPKHFKRLCYIDRESLPESKEGEEQFGNTISNATFSKLLGPGIRVGYQETATPALAYLISQGGAHRSGGSPSQLNTVIVGELIKSGTLDVFIRKLREAYGKRGIAIVEAVRKYLPKGTTVCGGKGGYFLWVTLPEEYDVRKICQACSKEDVILANGDNFEVPGDKKNWGASSVRLSLSHMDEVEIDQAIKIWGALCEDYKI